MFVFDASHFWHQVLTLLLLLRDFWQGIVSLSYLSCDIRLVK